MSKKKERKVSFTNIFSRHFHCSSHLLKRNGFLLALTLIAHTVESCHQIGEAFVLHVWQLEGFVISHFENT